MFIEIFFFSHVAIVTLLNVSNNIMDVVHTGRKIWKL